MYIPQRIFMSFRSPINEATHGLQFSEHRIHENTDFPPSYEAAIQEQKI